MEGHTGRLPHICVHQSKRKCQKEVYAKQNVLYLIRTNTISIQEQYKNGCNIGGGEVTLNIFPGWKSPWLSFINIRKRVEYRQEEPKGVGGEEEEEL